MSGCEACACVEPQRIEASHDGADTCAIIVAGGNGSRFGDPRGKQYVELCGLPLACWSLVSFDRAPSVGHIVVVCAPGREEEMHASVLGRIALSTPVTLAHSGEERQDSVRLGLSAVPDGYELVAVHDAVRPMVSVDDIERCIACVRADHSLAGAICAARSTDTLKLVEGNTVIATPDRSFYWCAQTPQVFWTRQLSAAHRAAVWDGYHGTDDASLVERRGGKIACVETSRANIKVTLPEDYAIAEVLMQHRLMSEGCGIDD